MPSLERVKFMVVDGNAHMVQIVKTLLRGFGVTRIVEARDAAEAFEHLKTDSIDIVIVEYMMEGLDGIEFIRLVRTAVDSPDRFIPIIMLTGRSERSNVYMARDAGATEFCCKPVTATQLFRKVVAIVDHPRPFICAPTFCGPDRRRKPDGTYAGPERRDQMQAGALPAF